MLTRVLSENWGKRRGDDTTEADGTRIIVARRGSDPKKWRNNLVRENRRWAVHTICDKGACSAMGDELLACKKLATKFKI